MAGALGPDGEALKSFPYVIDLNDTKSGVLILSRLIKLDGVI